MSHKEAQDNTRCIHVKQKWTLESLNMLSMVGMFKLHELRSLNCSRARLEGREPAISTLVGGSRGDDFV